MLSTIQTLDQLNLILSELTDLEFELSSGNQINWTEIEQEVSPITASLLKPLTKSTSPLTELKQLKNQLSHYRLIDITVAIDPSADAITQMSQFIKTSVGADALVNLHINPALIGGCQISYQGKYHDYSIRRKLESYHVSSSK